MVRPWAELGWVRHAKFKFRCCLITSLSTAVRLQAALRVLYVSEREEVVPESTINSSGVVSPRIRRHLTGLSHSYPTALHYLFTLWFKKPLGSVNLLSFSGSNVALNLFYINIINFSFSYLKLRRTTKVRTVLYGET